MAWPTEAIDTTHFDAATDDASQARSEIEKMANNVNAIKDSKGAVDGIASLDSGGKIPTNELPVMPAPQGGTGQQAYTVGDILYANATNTLTKLSAGTIGYVLKSNGPGAAPSWQQEGGGLTSGTRMIFQNTTAPTGWTKETNSAFNDAALRIVTGSVASGGASGFSAVFGTGKSTAGHSLSIAEMPAHTHAIRGRTDNFTGSTSPQLSRGGANVNGQATASAGNSDPHTHGLALDIKYRDFILAQKN